MNPHDDQILMELSSHLADLGVRENDAELIRDVAQQWLLVIQESNVTYPHKKQPLEPIEKQNIKCQSKRILIVSYRFDPEIAGGSELHTWMLARELIQAGIDVDVFTTRNRVFRPTSSYGIKWENNTPRGMIEIDGIRVHRYTTLNLPRIMSRGMSYWIRRRRDWEDSRIETLRLEGALLGTGWHEAERWEDGATFRWTAYRTAHFILAEDNVSGISMEVFCPRSFRGKLEVGEDRKPFSIAAGDWQLLRFTFEPRSNPCVIIRVHRLWKPRGDPRELGVAVRNIRYKSGDQWQTLPMERDLHWALGELDGESIVAVYRQLMNDRPRLYDWLYMLARGPLALWMYIQLYRQMPRYHAVIANMIPFNTLCFTSWAGKRRKAPVLLLPLMHHRDHYHHWGHFYRAMERSTTILANSRFSEKLFQSLGYNAHFVGAGVDPIQYTKSNIKGVRFRRKFQLERVPIALFVGRKIHSKRYDMAVEAVEIVNSKGRDLRLVMIGPDEDGAPICSPFVLALGKVSSRDLLDAYDACNIFVLPSEMESFGMVYLEAWMRKKPVIGLRKCDAVASLIEDGVDGFLCGSAEEIAQRILYLLDNPVKAQCMGDHGFQKTMENHTWERVGRRVLEILDKIW